MRRRLAGAVEAEQRDDLAFADRQRDVAQDADLPVARAQLVDGEQRLRHARALLRRGTRCAPTSSAAISAGVPSASSLPRSSTVTRSARRARRACCARRTGRSSPSRARRSRMTPMMRSVSASASPAIGSSSSTSTGSVDRLIAISTRRCEPCASSATSRSRCAARLTKPSSSSTRASTARLRVTARRAQAEGLFRVRADAEPNVLVDGQLREHARRLKRAPHPHRDAAPVRRPRDVACRGTSPCRDPGTRSPRPR